MEGGLPEVAGFDTVREEELLARPIHASSGNHPDQTYRILALALANRVECGRKIRRRILERRNLNCKCLPALWEEALKIYGGDSISQ